MDCGRLALALLFLLASSTSTAAAATGDGRIVASAPFAWPDKDVEVTAITYLSDGLKIKGFLCRPRGVPGKKPVLIWNHGNLGAASEISPEHKGTLDEMAEYARAGFLVIASQYRGIGGSEGKDEIAGADTHDVENLIPLARSLPDADAAHIVMWGFSRGALMTFQALADGAPVEAAVVVGPPSNFAELEARDPEAAKRLGASDPSYASDHAAFVERRSPVRWIDRVDTPLLILQGGADPGVPPALTLALAGKLEAAHLLYELHIYAGDDHAVSRNRGDRIARAIAWFRARPRLSIASVLARVRDQRGVEAAVAAYADLKKTKADRYDFGERELNRWGYLLFLDRHPKDALAILRLNTEAFPSSANVWDSLAEVELASGDRAAAIAHYQKSLAIDPKNQGAADKLKELGPAPAR